MQKGDGPEDEAGRGWETSIKGLGEEGVGKDEKGVEGSVRYPALGKGR